MTQPLEYWSIISLHGIDEPRIFRSDLYQCIMNTAMFEQAGYFVTIGMYDKILYQSYSSNSKIFARTVNSNMTDVHTRIIYSVGVAYEYFRYLINIRYHDGGYWELLDSNHFFQAYSGESIINVIFIWRPLHLKTGEEVDWMKEGF